VGAGLMTNLGATLGATNHGGVNVVLKSSDPTVSLLAPDATTAATDSIVIFVPNNQSFFSYYVHGLNGKTGTVAVTARASGFTDGSATATVAPPAADIIFLQTTISATAANNQFQLRLGLPDANHNFMQVEQQIRFGGPAFTATVSNSNASAAQLVTQGGNTQSASVTIAPGQARSPFGASNGGVEFDPLAPGTTSVSATFPTIPGFIVIPTATVGVTVN
jgi:hypothetical protein